MARAILAIRPCGLVVGDGREVSLHLIIVVEYDGELSNRIFTDGTLPVHVPEDNKFVRVGYEVGIYLPDPACSPASILLYPSVLSFQPVGSLDDLIDSP